MTLDLFDDEPAVCDSVQVALPSKSVDPERLAYALEPCGLNRWQYRGEILIYDTRAAALAWRPRWSTVEGIGRPEIRGDSHVEVCKAIDARRGSGLMGYKNPLLDLPAGRALMGLPAADRKRIEKVMRELRAEANEQAETAVRRRKGPMYAYWRAVSTYARHIAHALAKGGQP